MVKEACHWCRTKCKLLRNEYLSGGRETKREENRGGGAGVSGREYACLKAHGWILEADENISTVPQRRRRWFIDWGTCDFLKDIHYLHCPSGEQINLIISCTLVQVRHLN